MSERRAGLEKGNLEVDLPGIQGRLPSLGKRATYATNDSTGVVATVCRHRETDATREVPTVVGRAHQLAIREGEAGPSGTFDLGGVMNRGGESKPRALEWCNQVAR